MGPSTACARCTLGLFLSTTRWPVAPTMAPCPLAVEEKLSLKTSRREGVEEYVNEYSLPESETATATTRRTRAKPTTSRLWGMFVCRLRVTPHPLASCGGARSCERGPLAPCFQRD